MPTDDWGGVAVDQPDDWGGIPVSAKTDDWGGIAVDSATPEAIESATRNALNVAIGPGSIAHANAVRDSFNQDEPPVPIPMVTPQPTFLGELKAGITDYRVKETFQHLGNAADIALAPIREAFSPLIGATETERIRDAVQFGTNEDGSPRYEYKPLGDRPTREAGLMTSFIPMQPFQPEEGDSKIDSAVKSAGNFAQGIIGGVFSPGGVATAATGGMLVPIGTKIGTAQLPNATRVLAGGFAAEMGAHVPQQIEQGLTGATLQDRIEGWLGAATGVAFAALGTHEAIKGRPKAEDIAGYVQGELAKLEPPRVAQQGEFRVIPPETLDGLNVARERLVDGFEGQPPEIQAQRQGLIDSIDAQLLEADPTARAESQQRLAQRVGESEAPPIAPLTDAAVAELGSNEIYNGVKQRRMQIDDAEKVRQSAREMDANQLRWMLNENRTNPHEFSMEFESIYEMMLSRREQGWPAMPRSATEAATQTGSPARNTPRQEQPAPGQRSTEPQAASASAENARSTVADQSVSRAIDSSRSEPLPEGYVGGPGAMGPVEASEMQANRVTTSTKNAVVDAERAARNADPIVREARKSNERTFSEAETLFESNPNIGQETVEALRNGVKREVSETDEAVLLFEKIRLRNERNMAAERAADIYSTEEGRAAARDQWNSLEQKINEIDEATRKSGTIWGRLGQFRQRLMRDDFTFEAMERKARVAKGEPLTPGESAKIKEQAERIAELEKQLEAAKTKATEKDATQAADTAVKKIGEDATEAAKKERRTGKKVDLETQRTNIIDTMKQRIADGDKAQDLKSFVQQLALNLVRSGVKERAPLVDGVHSVLAKMIPEITPEQTRDLISGYGDFSPLSREPANVTLRGLKGELQQVAKIEEMMAGQAPKKTGMERRLPTDEERRLIKEVNELKKKGGFQITDPATQLKTAMEAIKTRLRNEIADLDAAIAKREPIVSKKGGIEYDAEAASLKTQRDAKHAQYDEVFPKAELTDAERITIAGKSLDRSIANLEADLKAGKIYADKSRPRPTSAELDAKRARLDALRAERDTLRDLDTARIESEKEAALIKAIDRAQQVIPEPKQGAATVDSKRIAELKATLEEALNARANSPESQQRKLELATQSVKKSIAELDRRLREGDFAQKTAPEQLRSNELDALRSERDALESFLREERNNLKPKKTREELALQAFKTRTANRIAELQERIAKGDFTPKAKPSPPKLDAGGQKLAYEIDRVKRQYADARFQDMQRRRPIVRKIFENARDGVNTARAVMTSFDLSAVLRQGGFITLANPVRAARAIPHMLRALFSPAKQHAINAEIQSRPNAELYRQSKLHLTDDSNPNLSAMEEAYMSRWTSKIPGVAASERAYTTFLNRLRADSFDAMVESLGRGDRITPQEANIIANFVNVATGRGNLAGAGNAGVSLNTAFFAPRYLLSRFELLSGQPLLSGLMKEGGAGTAKARALVAKEYAKFLIGVSVVYGLAQAAGATVESDSRSSDFGKIRFGNTRIDPLSGLAQVTTLSSRLIQGETKTSKGDVIPIRGDKVKFGGASGADLIGRFLRTKLAPWAGSIVDVAAGRNVVGEKVTTEDVLKRAVIPLSLGDIAKTMEEQGVPRGPAISILSLLGWGVQNYDSSEKKK